MNFEGTTGNPDIHWETSVKDNIGIETGFMKNLISVNFDYFWEHRFDMLISGTSRNVPDYYGAAPVTGNLGEVKTEGWELEARFSKQFRQGIHLYGGYTHTFVKDEIIYREDPELAPEYQKQAGYPIGQTSTRINDHIIQSWDEIYTGVMYEDNTALTPGNYRQLDFNADGIVNTLDSAPWQYPSHPQYTYSFNFGAEYKGFNLNVQFYGVYNITRRISLIELHKFAPIIYEYQRERMWSPEYGNTDDAEYRHPGIIGGTSGDFWHLDASYLRLKNLELGYSLPESLTDRLNISNVRFFVNGTNLFFWSDLPEDREGGDWEINYHNYPMMKRFNFGTNITF
jgi:hypothetical protein